MEINGFWSINKEDLNLKEKVSYNKLNQTDIVHSFMYKPKPNSFFNFLPNCIAMISAININPVKNTTINSFSGYGIKSCSILDVKCALISYPIIQVPSLKIILS